MGGQVLNVVAIVAFWPLAYRMWPGATELPVVVAAPPSPA